MATTVQRRGSVFLIGLTVVKEGWLLEVSYDVNFIKTVNLEAGLQQRFNTED